MSCVSLSLGLGRPKYAWRSSLAEDMTSFVVIKVCMSALSGMLNAWLPGTKCVSFHVRETMMVWQF